MYKTYVTTTVCIVTLHAVTVASSLQMTAHWRIFLSYRVVKNVMLVWVFTEVLC